MTHPRTDKAPDGRDQSPERGEFLQQYARAHAREGAPAAIATTPHHQALDPKTADAARRIVQEGTPANTIRARAADLRAFWGWAAQIGLEERYPIPAETVIRYLTEHLDTGDESSNVKKPLSVATLERRVSTLSSLHQSMAIDPNPAKDPRVVEILKAARRIRAAKGGQRQADAVVLGILERMLATCRPEHRRLDLRDVRDRALLLVGFAAGGRRRSELAALRVDDLTDADDGAYLWNLRRSKTDQEGAGHVVAITGRAADALREWLEAAGVADGPVFRRVYPSGRTVGEDPLTGTGIGHIVKQRAAAAGLEDRAISPHSLRAGFITEAFRRGHGLPDIMGASGHRSVPAVTRYGRAEKALRNPTANLAG